MKNKNKLMLAQLDLKLSFFKQAEGVIKPDKGWIHTIRTTLNITLRQLGEKLNVSAQSIQGLEEREASGAITLNALKDLAGALDLKVIYALVPNTDSLEKLIEKRSLELARKIVLRTSASMKLENQENTLARLEKAVNEKAQELRDELPKYLWD